MGNDRAAVQQAGVYVCRNNDIGDGTPCPWFERDRVAAISAQRINVGQGMFLVAAVQCECGSYLHDQGGPSQQGGNR
jgi:hypothetical protein